MAVCETLTRGRIELDLAECGLLPFESNMQPDKLIFTNFTSSHGTQATDSIVNPPEIEKSRGCTFESRGLKKQRGSVDVLICNKLHLADTWHCISHGPKCINPHNY